MKNIWRATIHSSEDREFHSVGGITKEGLIGYHQPCFHLKETFLIIESKQLVWKKAIFLVDGFQITLVLKGRQFMKLAGEVYLDPTCLLNHSWPILVSDSKPTWTLKSYSDNQQETSSCLDRLRRICERMRIILLKYLYISVQAQAIFWPRWGATGIAGFPLALISRAAILNFHQCPPFH